MPARFDTTYTDGREALLGGRVVVLNASGRWVVGHEPSGGHVTATTRKAALEAMHGVATSTTLAEADSHAAILPRGTVDLIDVFLADPENEPSPAGIAARRALFR